MLAVRDVGIIWFSNVFLLAATLFRNEFVSLNQASDFDTAYLFKIFQTTGQYFSVAVRSFRAESSHAPNDKRQVAFKSRYFHDFAGSEICKADFWEYKTGEKSWGRSTVCFGGSTYPSALLARDLIDFYFYKGHKGRGWLHQFPTETQLPNWMCQRGILGNFKEITSAETAMSAL